MEQSQARNVCREAKWCQIKFQRFDEFFFQHFSQIGSRI